MTNVERGAGRSETGGPAPDRVTVAVNRYFKGDGPGNLVFTFDGLGWEQMNPAGSELVMALREDEKTKEYQAGACLLRINAKPTNPFEEEMRTLIQKQYGEGEAPAVPAHEPRGQWFLYGSLGAFVVLTASMRIGGRGRTAR